MNVLLVVLDSVRARNLGPYGHVNETTPFLASFLDGATLYEQAKAPGAWSFPSHASLFTGLHVAEHGVRAWEQSVGPGHTIWEALRADGYETGVFSTNTFVTKDRFGLTRGFGTVCGASSFVPYPEAIDPTEYFGFDNPGAAAFAVDALRSGSPFRSLLNGVSIKARGGSSWLSRVVETMDPRAPVERFVDWQRRREGPWAACLNLMDAHVPYRPTAEHDLWGGDGLRDLQADLAGYRFPFLDGREPWWKRRALEALYDGAIRQLDGHLERLVTALADDGALEETLLVVTSDHGEGFGEPSRVRPGFRVPGHKVGVHEALFHVPLVVKLPGQRHGQRIPDPVSVTQFPAAVRAARDGDAMPGTFVTDGPVVAEATTDDLPGAPDDFDVGGLTEPARLRYDRADGHVRKSVTWGDYEATVDVFDAQQARTVPHQAARGVDGAFRSLDAHPISTDATGELAGATRDQLERLGYL